MVHNLFGERYIGMRTPAWHQLGITAPDEEQLTTAEAFARAGLNFRYHTLPIGVTLPDGTFVTTNSEAAVYREPTPDDPQWRHLGIVSKGYSYLQNAELAQGLDAIAEQTGWKFETAGALGKGETVFACLKTGKHSVHGDEMDSYLLITDGKAANRALRIVDTTIRVVCQNTLLRAESDNSMSITVPHASGVETQFKFWLDLIASLIKSQEDTLVELRRMGDAKISDDIARRIFLDAFPEPVQNQRVKLSKSIPAMNIAEGKKVEAAGALAPSVQAYEYNMAQSLKWREASFDLYNRFNSGAEQGGSMSGAATAKLSRTAYAALQAVTEICDWGGTNRDTVASATLFGARAAQKSRAWVSALRASDSVLN